MKLLIVKLSSLGDVIQTMPVVADVLQKYPQAQIDWVVEEAFAPLVERVQGVRTVIPIAQRRWRKSRWAEQTIAEKNAFRQKLQAQAFDAVLDFQGLIKSAWVARQARLTHGGFTGTYGNASELCGYEWPVRWILQRTYPMPRRIHAVARYRALASAALGTDTTQAARYALTHHGVPTPGVVVLAHGTTRADNEWPAADWLLLARHLVAQGHHVALPQANAQESVFAHAIAAEIGPMAQVWPRLSLAQVLDRMANCSGVIGVDSGLSHLAVALDLPHVQIFSQPRVWRAGPVGCEYQVAVGGDAAPDVSVVWQAWLQVVRARSGSV